mmetsp:Transcript_47382/g.144166  ORF Transcript_47382/g.144166 Transcript_47382/m.144166 type:complete len:228 (-) Transcript_47382:484-1167(-)
MLGVFPEHHQERAPVVLPRALHSDAIREGVRAAEDGGGPAESARRAVVRAAQSVFDRLFRLPARRDLHGLRRIAGGAHDHPLPRRREHRHGRPLPEAVAAEWAVARHGHRPQMAARNDHAVNATAWRSAADADPERVIRLALRGPQVRQFRHPGEPRRRRVGLRHGFPDGPEVARGACRGNDLRGPRARIRREGWRLFRGPQRPQTAGGRKRGAGVHAPGLRRRLCA